MIEDLLADKRQFQFKSGAGKAGSLTNPGLVPGYGEVE
jgi:hypothetical protein